MVALWMELRDASVRLSRPDVREAIDACFAANAGRIGNGLATSVSSKGPISSALLGLYVLVLAMAYCGALHRAIHTDAGSAEHQCAVTLLSHGQIDASETGASVFVPLRSVQTAELSPVFQASNDHSLLPARGPPSFVSSSPVAGQGQV
jgi:hypothetical protein